MTQDCALILLASGLSKRFGPQNKLLADLGGRPLIEHVLGNLEGVSFAKKYVVLSDPRVSDIVSAREYEVIENQLPEEGQGSALSFGAARAKQGGAVSACILLADMPFIDASVFKGLESLSKTQDVTMSEFAGIKMPPAIFRNNAFDRLQQVRGLQAKPYLGADHIATYPLTRLQAIDIDTPADLAAARELV